MSEIREHVAYLSREIGPRPAGTEEEQKAALYLADVLKNESGLETSVEEFNCNADFDLPRVVYCAITLVVALLTLFLPMMVIPALIVSLIAGALFASEAFGVSLFGKMMSRGVSQNVVAKYEPAVRQDGSRRRRKVVVVAHYDSGRVRNDLTSPLFPAIPMLKWAELGAMCLVPVLMLVRLISNADGAFLVVLNVLVVLCMILALLPIVACIASRTAAYNEGANCNASGVAVMAEVAARVSHSRAWGEEGEQAEVTMHGEEYAQASGLVPEGAELVYEANEIKGPEFDDGTPEARLLAAKAAVAALSGKPVSNTINIDVSENLVQVEEPLLEMGGHDAEEMLERREEAMEAFAAVPAEVAAEAAVTAAAAAPVIAAAAAVEPQVPHEVPAWFKSAQEKARKNVSVDEKPPHRSRYADALDAAVRESSTHFAQANQAITAEAEQRLQQMRNSIMEVKAPGFDDIDNYVPEPVSKADPSVAAVVDDAALGETIAMPPVEPVGGSFEAAAGTTTHPSGVDGYLSNATTAETYAEVRAHEENQRERFEIRTRETAVAPTGSRAEQVVGKSEQSTDEKAVAENIDRTISFLPVVMEAAQSPAKAERKKRDIALPSFTGSFAPIDEAHKQRAPLADRAEGVASNAQGLRSNLPQIATQATASTDAAASRQQALRSMLPSLSGALSPIDAAKAVEESSASSGELDMKSVAAEEAVPVNQAGAFAPMGATGAFAPIGSELVEDTDPEDLFVEDVDDSAYEEQMTETGAFAGPGYVEMPKSRASRFFSKFRFGKKKRQQESTPQEWIGVDEDFEAREVGKARGSWDSFRQDDDELEQTQLFDTVADDDNEAAYGDAYNPNANQNSEYASYEDEYDDYDDFDDYYENDSYGGSRKWNGGGFSRSALEKLKSRAKGDKAAEKSASSESRETATARERLRRRAEARAEESVVASLPLEDYAEEAEQIRNFRYQSIDTEVWFVALGSELADNAGMKAFLAAHAADLKGSIIIDLDGMGAGALTLIEQEGLYRAVKPSSRMKRYVRKAGAALGMGTATGKMLWRESAAACATRQGYQVMHLVGMEKGKPALCGEPDDVIDNVSDDVMLANADFVMEVIRNI